MRIAFLTHQWPGARMGGIGTYTSLCAHALARAGHEVHVFTFALPPELRAHLAFHSPKGLTVHEVAGFAQRVHDKALPAVLGAAVHAGGEASYRLGHACLLSAAARDVHTQLPFDIVETPEYESLGLPLALEPLEGAALVTQLHSGSAINRLGNGRPRTDEEWSLDAMETAMILSADGLCAPSRHVAAISEEQLGIKCDATILPLPVPLSTEFHVTLPPEDGPVIFVGRLERLKGAEVLARALPEFLRRCPQARVRILGPDTPTATPDAAGSTSMQRFMQSQLPPDVADRVEFLGERSRMDIHAEFEACSFLIVPSLFESFSLVCAEAMALGRTAIVSSNIGTTEVIGDAGQPFARGDSAALALAMISLFQDRPRLIDLSRRAYDRARNELHENVVIPRRIAFYEQVIQKTRSAARLFWHKRLENLPAPAAVTLLGTLMSITAFISGTPSSLTLTPGLRLLRAVTQYSFEIESPVQFFLYGAGRHTARLLAEKHLWESHGHRCLGIIDDHPRFTSGGTAYGLPVLSRTAWQQANPAKTDPVIILSTDTFEEQFWDQTAELREQGVAVLRLYTA